ncbi:hypothetical protein COCVIDRAFT_42478 [Bipolaris victoriae FI3]|uniref:Heterokaryon incompatibility domain-containing protein n=1 Tax=Bipolaris victoriae (strain FI3) TaxID=930091 RepID=W7EBU8_BIPV3|nr:hypothetical protein COCVIDRAFT_42478 [Bipolaris victoriae FI3]
MSFSSHSYRECCRAQSVSPPTYSPLELDQIRVLRILPTIIPGRSGHYHQNGRQNDCEQEDCRALTESMFETVLLQNFESGRSLPQECCRDGSVCIECDMIQCELVTVSLEEYSGAFDALSYMWGYTDTKERIKMDSKTIEVTLNLEAALRRVRNMEKAKLLWVDGLCINQQDVEEKNVQVMRMKNIYTRCGRVLVWLGDALIDESLDGKNEVDNAVRAISFLKKAHKIARGKDMVGKPDYHTMFMSRMTVTVPFKDPSTVGLPVFGAPEWVYLSKFSSRPWFGRVWIIQEASGTNWFIAYAYPDNIDGLEGLRNVSMIDTCRRLKAMPLMRRLDQIYRFNSTIPHDKICAVLGLSIESATPERYPRLRVDYARDWQAVFRDVVRHCIEMSGSWGPKSTLHILSYISQERDDDENFAWDKTKSSWPIVQRMYHFAFQTTYDTEPCIVESQDDRIISLKGIFVDIIAKVYNHLIDIREDHDPLFSLEVFRAVTKTWRAILCDPPWRFLGGKRYPLLGEVFAKAITEGSICRSPGTGSLGQQFAAYWEVGLQYAKENELGILPRFNTFLAPLNTAVEKWPSNERIDKAIFVTETGYIGCGPPITRVGDDLCVIYRGKTPFVVQKVKKGPECPAWLNIDLCPSTSSVKRFQGPSRRWNPFHNKKPEQFTLVPLERHALILTNRYRLVGECYVEGLQKGKALDLRDKGDLQEDIIYFV